MNFSKKNLGFYITLILIGILLIWIKYPTMNFGIGVLFYKPLLIIYFILLGIYLFIALFRLIKRKHKFDFFPLIITVLIFFALLAVYIYDDVDRLQVKIIAHDESSKSSNISKTHGHSKMFMFNVIKLFTNNKYQILEYWPESGRQFRGKYIQVGDTIIFDNDIISKTDSGISNKYIFDAKTRFMYYIDSKTSKIDSLNKFEY